MSDNVFSKLSFLLKNENTEFMMEAHSALSAKIVEETGFNAIWASGLSISTALGVRDSNEASWTQILDVLEFMTDVVEIPILLDGDTGYGNFNNVRRLVKKMCQKNIAGVCIEDKLFPKTNSFLGNAQPLADIDEFCGKIKAAKDSQTESKFSVVARVEALIAGHGMPEALKRAEAYTNAGADAILIHSKRADSYEIENFAKEWAQRSPLIIVPTKYYKTPTDIYKNLKISMIIWANHNLRSSISAMKSVCRTIKEEESLLSIEPIVASLEEVFKITHTDELLRAEEVYLPKIGAL